MGTCLTRRVTFDAAHRYWRSDWSDDENRRVFGSWATPKFHSHGYVCDVTVTGEVDHVTGMLVDLGRLDRILQTEVRDRFDRRETNAEVPEFTDGRLVPTCENLTRFIAECVQRALGSEATVTAVRVAEDETISATHQRDQRDLPGRGRAGTCRGSNHRKISSMSDVLDTRDATGPAADGQLDAVEEAAVWLDLNGAPAVTWMCTPERLDELVVGWLFGEGYIDNQSEIVRMRPCTSELGFWVEVPLDKYAAVERAERRRVL